MKNLKIIENHSGVRNLAGFIDDEIVPILEPLDKDPVNQSGLPKALQWPMGITVVLFLILHQFITRVLPDTTMGEIVSVLLFPLTFIAMLAGMIYVMRRTIVDLFVASRARFLIRTKALKTIALKYGIDYVPLPGGPSKALQKFAAWKRSPQVIKDMVATMSEHSGIDDIADIIRKSGLAMPRGSVLGTKEQLEKYYEQQIDAQQFEDGFKGRRGRIDFSALEWRESFNEETVNHLLVVMKLPTKLSGVVEFKSKDDDWPIQKEAVPLKSVRLISKAFHKKYSVRAGDQTEARLIFDPAVIERLNDFSSSGAVRAVAYEDNLVFDITGQQRFDMVNLITGAWSRETIIRTCVDIDEMLALVDQVGHAFSVKKNRL